MCLFPFGFGGGGMDSVPPPNEKCRKYVAQLKIVMWCQVILGIINLFLGFSGKVDLFSGFIDLILACILCSAYSQIDYCNCILYIFFCILRFVGNFTAIGKLIQNETPLFNKDSTRNFAVGVVIFSLVYYVVAIYFVFYAYREFKGKKLL